MLNKFLITVLLYASCNYLLSAQSETYVVKKSPFSSDRYDEYCPVYYKDGIVFSSNMNNGLKNYSNSDNKGLFNIYYVDTTDQNSSKKSRLFSKNLTTILNDGPITFNSAGDTAYFCRNLMVDGNLREISSKRNKIGLFTASFVNGEWTRIKELRVNSDWYNVISPSLSADGKRLFLASDKPGGFGGFDIYYCEWRGDHWDDPINMGPEINTEGDESYPFISPVGELFFSSTGHKSLGGKDIFISRFYENKWLPPVRLDEPINSKSDDFGFVTDSLVSEGYFSSNRDKTVDIYSFKTLVPQVFYTIPQKENNFCFVFRDTGSINIDTLNLKYIWDFGDDSYEQGKTVTKCYKGPGSYNVRLLIVDKLTGDIFFTKLSYTLVLTKVEQAYINSPDMIVKDRNVSFDGLDSNLPGYSILSYSWDFGDSVKEEGEKVQHIYKNAGTYTVNLGVLLKSEASGKVHRTGTSKRIQVLGSLKDSLNLKASEVNKPAIINMLKKQENVMIQNLFSAESLLSGMAQFRIEVLTSKTKAGTNNSSLRNLSARGGIAEVYDNKNDLYRYLTDPQMNLMSTFYTYRQVVASGFKTAHAIIEPVADPASRELINLKKIFGASTDSYFDSNRKLTSTAYLFLDQLVKLLNKYPDYKLEIKVFTDNSGTWASKIQESQEFGDILARYLTEKGIDKNRMIVRGLGAAFPVESNNSDKSRALNRRIDFTIFK